MQLSTNHIAVADKFNALIERHGLKASDLNVRLAFDPQGDFVTVSYNANGDRYASIDGEEVAHQVNKLISQVTNSPALQMDDDGEIKMIAVVELLDRLDRALEVAPRSRVTSR